jgi:hypothetical protein
VILPVACAHVSLVISQEDASASLFEEAHMRSRWGSEFGWGVEFRWQEKNAPGPQTEDSRERGFRIDANEDNLGHSDELDVDCVGDIADEGPGRRG